MHDTKNSIIEDKLVLVVEKSSYPMSVIDTNNFILEGIAAVFDKVNENGRIYTWEEYKPHLIYLLAKIERHKLVGEMDHPQKFETSLRSITHIVQKLWYDEKDNVLRIRIKLLDTDPHGLNARKLINAGFPLSLSSRSAGVVGKDKTVSIKHIFAFDLVADGGFGDAAELKRVSESLGFNPEKYTIASNINEERCMNGVCAVTNKNIKIINISDKYPGLLESLNFKEFDFEHSNMQILNESIHKKNKKNKTNIMENTTNEITEAAMQEFSVIVQNEFKRINRSIDEISKKVNAMNENNGSDERVEGLVTYVDKLAEFIRENKNSISDGESLKESLELVKESSTNLKKYAERLGKEIQNNRDFSERLSTEIQSNRDGINEAINFSESSNEKIETEINDLISYNNKIHEAVNLQIKYLDRVQKTVNGGIRYTEHIAKNSVVKEDFIHLANYTDAMLEEKGSPHTKHLNENADIDANNKDTFDKESYSKIGNKIDTILEKIEESKKAAKTFIYGSTRMLNTAQLSVFEGLNKSQKDVADKLLLSGSTFEHAIDTASNPEAKFITQMPEEYKDAWEKLDENRKANLIKRSKAYKLETEYQIRNFWANQQIESLPIETLKINESKKNDIEVPSLGYSSSLVDEVAEAMKRF